VSKILKIMFAAPQKEFSLSFILHGWDAVIVRESGNKGFIRKLCLQAD